VSIHNALFLNVKSFLGEWLTMEKQKENVAIFAVRGVWHF